MSAPTIGRRDSYRVATCPGCGVEVLVHRSERYDSGQRVFDLGGRRCHRCPRQSPPTSAVAGERIIDPATAVGRAYLDMERQCAAARDQERAWRDHHAIVVAERDRAERRVAELELELDVVRAGRR